MLDTSSPFGAHAEQRLRQEQTAWLVTVGRDGTPQPRPVWFLWDGTSILVYTEPSSAKVRHIARNPHVSVHFDTDGEGGDVVVVTGVASVDSSVPAVDQLPAYLEKYRQAMAELGHDPPALARIMSVPLRVTPTRVRGFLE